MVDEHHVQVPLRAIGRRELDKISAIVRQFEPFVLQKSYPRLPIIFANKKVHVDCRSRLTVRVYSVTADNQILQAKLLSFGVDDVDWKHAALP